ncbi:MAG TPA: lipid II flippase MurJ [Abditibacteriaceae bacterium]
MTKHSDEYSQEAETNAQSRDGARPVDDLQAVAPDSSIARDDAPAEVTVTDTEAANAMQTREAGKGVARATAGIVPMHLARFVFGFLAPILIANRLGLDTQAKAYSISTDILQRIWLVFEKVVNPSFLPVFIRSLKEDGEERAWKFTSTALFVTCGLLLLATPLAYWQMPGIVHLYVNESKTTAQQFDSIVTIGRWLLVGLPFLAISSLTYVILNGYKRFAAAAFGDALWKLGVLVCAVVAWRLNLLHETALYVITLGFVIGSFLKLLPQLIVLREKWHLLRPHFNLNDPLFRSMLVLGGPLLVGILISEARSIYIANLADADQIQVKAGLAALKWSRTIGDTLIQIFPYALSIGVFPYLADLARQRDRQPLTDTLVSALRVCIFVFTPLTAILIALRFPLLRAVWESGNMTQQDTIDMSWPFLAYTLGLIAFSCEMMLNQTFYAMTNTWTPTLIGICTSLLWVGLATVGLEYSGNLATMLGVPHNLGLAALAGSESVAKTVKCILLWLLLRKHLGRVRIGENLTFALKVIAGSIAAGFIAGVVAQTLGPASGVSHFKIKMLLTVCAAGCSGLVIFVALGALVGVQEVRSIIGFVDKVRKRFAR